MKVFRVRYKKTGEYWNGDSSCSEEGRVWVNREEMIEHIRQMNEWHPWFIKDCAVCEYNLDTALIGEIHCIEVV